MKAALFLAGALGLCSAAQAQGSQAAPAPCSGKLITHALGQTCVKGTPRRVVTLEWTYTENLLALGVPPVGAADLAGYREWVKKPAVPSSVQDVGTRQQPNLELVRALKPDLIVTAKLRATQNYAQLAAIAPTVVFDPFAAASPFAEMRQTMTTLGELLGRRTKAQQVLSDLDARLARLARDVARAGHRGETFVLAQAFTARGGTPTMRLFTKNSLASEVIERLGLVNTWNAPSQPYGYSELGLEGLASLNTQRLFFIVQKEDNVFAAPSVAPLWKGLPFVRSGRTHALDERTWTFGGPLSAQVLAEAVAAPLTRPR